MENKEFSKYFSWCDSQRIRVYPVRTENEGEFVLVVERNGHASKGTQLFYDKPNKDQKCVWKQIGILLKAIYEKENKELNTKQND